MLPVYVFYGIPLESWSYLRHREVSLRPSRSCSLNSSCTRTHQSERSGRCLVFLVKLCMVYYVIFAYAKEFVFYVVSSWDGTGWGLRTGRFTEMPHSKLSNKRVRSTKTCCYVYMVCIHLCQLSLALWQMHNAVQTLDSIKKLLQNNPKQGKDPDTKRVVLYHPGIIHFCCCCCFYMAIY